MSDHGTSPILFEDSFTAYGCQGEVETETFDINHFTTQAIDEFIRGGTTAVTNSMADDHSQAPQRDDDNQRTPGVHSGPRSRVKYANQHVLAGSDLFLKAGVQETSELILEGVIVECPNKNKAGNLGRYRVDWTRTLPSSFNRSLLAEWLPSTKATRIKLQAAMVRYQEQVKLQAQDPVTPSHDDHATANPGTAVGTPPVIVRQANRALLITAADHSTVSTLTGGGSSSQLRTRQTILVDSESDDDSDLDEADNAWEATDGKLHDLDTTHHNSSSLDEPDPPATTDSSLAHHISRISWKFKVHTNERVQPIHQLYTRPAQLRPGVAESFQDPTESLEKCSGLGYSFIHRLTANSNTYFEVSIRPGLDRNRMFHGIPWVNISVKEMYKFLGILLQISMREIDGGGYKAYFRQQNNVLITGAGRRAKRKEVANTAGFAAKYMTLRRFKQIRAAFHPEDKLASLGGDKCYQLRHAINALNSSSAATFIPSGTLAFDEGGVACRSRLCPVRQYNKDKPDKYRVDFFILADSHSYAILHIDVYQGRNSENVCIDERARDLPTTMKAVMNAVYQLGIDNDVEHGWRMIAMDNRYQCPELALILRDRCKIYSTGTCRLNRKGWPSEILNLSKANTVRGQSLMAYDEVNDVLCLQWRDNKVVNCCTTLTDMSITTVGRRVGSGIDIVDVPRVLKTYQENMYGVDKGDQKRMHMGGFARKAHYKKWYKKSFFAILDCMLLNALTAWNMSAQSPSLKRNQFERYNFYEWIADDFLNFDGNSASSTDDIVHGIVATETTACTCVPTKRGLRRCAVCQLDANYSNITAGTRNRVVFCLNCQVGVHDHVPEMRRQIHKLFPGMTCHEIIRSQTGKEIFFKKEKGKRQTHTIQRNHPIVCALREMHGVSRKRLRPSILPETENVN